MRDSLARSPLSNVRLFHEVIMKARWIVGLMLAAVVMPVVDLPAAGAEASLGEEAAAVVGGRRISAAELREALARERQSGEMPKVLATLTPQGKERILNDLVERSLLAARARSLGLDKGPRFDRSLLAAAEAILAELLTEREIEALDFGDAALRAYHEANPDEFRAQRRVKARHIVVATEVEAKEARKEIQAGKDFGETAAARNVDSSRSAGGDLGWVVPGVMARTFEEALFSLKTGDVSGIVKTSYGFHLVKAEAVDEGKVRPFDEVKGEVKKRLMERRLRELKEEIRQTVPVEVNRKILENSGEVTAAGEPRFPLTGRNPESGRE